MFEAELAESGVLRKVLDAVKDLCPDVNLQCKSDGMEIQTMDSTHVSLICVMLGSELFKHYRCDMDVTLGIRAESFANALKHLPSNAPVTIRKQDDEEYIRLHTDAASQEGGFEREAIVKLIELENVRLTIPEQEYQVVATFPSKTLQTLFRDFGSVAEHVTMTVNDRLFQFEVDADQGKLNNNFTNHHGVSWRFGGSHEDVQLEYGLRYLNMFAKGTPLCDTAYLCVAGGVPLKLSYPFHQSGVVSFYLAPKME